MGITKLDPKDPAEDVLLTVDFSNLLSPSNDSISSLVSITPSLLSGTDTNPSATWNGNSTVGSNTVTFMMIGGLDQNTYEFAVIVQTIQGQIFKESISVLVRIQA